MARWTILDVTLDGLTLRPSKQNPLVALFRKRAGVPGFLCCVPDFHCGVLWPAGHGCQLALRERIALKIRIHEINAFVVVRVVLVFVEPMVVGSHPGLRSERLGDRHHHYLEISPPRPFFSSETVVRMPPICPNLASTQTLDLRNRWPSASLLRNFLKATIFWIRHG